MTSLPDWLVERAALEEVPSVCRDRIERADRQELAARVAQLREENAAELSAYPAGPAVALIERRVVEVRRRRRRRQLTMVTLAAAAAVLLVAWPRTTAAPEQVAMGDEEVTRAKGAARLTVFRQAGDHAERLDEDALVRAGDSIQVRYSAGGKLYGLIASVDGAGVVTLHYPANADAPALATALAQKPTSLPQAYVLDDAPQFERFFFITSEDPIEVAPTLGALRTFAKRGNSATASVDLPVGLHQWTIRLRKGTP
jgi:hypothetical protein